MKLIPALTVSQVSSAVTKSRQTGERIELRDGLQPGLTFRTGKSGSKWSLQIVVAGTRRRLPLGVYPDMSLAQARAEAAGKRKNLASHTPTNNNITTLDGLVDAYKTYVGNNLKTWHTNEAPNRIRSVLAPHLTKPLSHLTEQALQRTIDCHPSRFTAAAATRYARPMFKWARKRGYCPVVGAELEEPKGANKARERVLSENELRVILPHLREPGNYPLAARLLLLTAVRLDELVSMNWSEIDLENAVWVIPAPRRKGKLGKKHELVVPLSVQACDLLRLAPKKPHPFKTLVNWGRWQKQFDEKTGISGWHRHDLRRTAATLMGQLGVEPHVIESSLGHAHLHSKLATIYNKSTYQPEVRKALQLLADYLDTL